MKLNQITRGVAAVALMASFGASAAMIKNDSDAVKVDARGLNLNSQQGQEVLYERLEVAAKQVCGETTVHRAGSLKRAMDCGARSQTDVLLLRRGLRFGRLPAA